MGKQRMRSDQTQKTWDIKSRRQNHSFSSYTTRQVSSNPMVLLTSANTHQESDRTLQYPSLTPRIPNVPQVRVSILENQTWGRSRLWLLVARFCKP